MVVCLSRFCLAQIIIKYLYDQVMIVMREEILVDNLNLFLLMNSLAKAQAPLRPWGKV